MTKSLKYLHFYFDRLCSYLISAMHTRIQKTIIVFAGGGGGGVGGVRGIFSRIFTITNFHFPGGGRGDLRMSYINSVIT